MISKQSDTVQRCSLLINSVLKNIMTGGKSDVPINYLFNSNTYGSEFCLCVQSATIICNTTRNRALLLKDDKCLPNNCPAVCV